MRSIVSAAVSAAVAASRYTGIGVQTDLARHGAPLAVADLHHTVMAANRAPAPQLFVHHRRPSSRGILYWILAKSVDVEAEAKVAKTQAEELERLARAHQRPEGMLTTSPDDPS